MADLHRDISNKEEELVRVENVDEKGEARALRAAAMQAEELERNMGIFQALKAYPSAAFWSFAISLCIVMEGYDYAAIGNILGMPQYRQKYGVYVGPTGNPDNDYQLTPAWQSAVGQASNIGCFLGIFLASWAQDRFGYRRTLQAALIALCGFIFIVFFAPNVETLFVGQFLCGFPWGCFASSAVAYASDVTPTPLRGYLTTYVNICWLVGGIIGNGILLAFLDRRDMYAYKIPFAIQWVWPVPLFVLITLAPESPWFLVRKGRLEEAKRVVQRLASRHSEVDADNTVAYMVRTNQFEIENETGGSLLDCFKGVDRRRTEIGCWAWACQPLCGLVFCGSPTYFMQQAGMESRMAFNVGLAVYCMGFAGTLVAWFSMAWCGRRTLYLWGLTGLLGGLLIIGGLTFPAVHSNGAQWGQAAMMMIWIFFFDVTIGPVAYAVVGETSSTRLRAKSVGLARNWYNVVNVCCGILNTYMINPTAWNWKGKAAFFWAGTCFCMLVWAYFRLPECKGRTYRDLDILFERRVTARKFKETVVTEQDEA